MANVITDAQVRDSTKKQYMWNLNHAVEWFSKKYPLVVDSDGLRHELIEGSQYTEYFTSVARKQESIV